MRKQQIENTEQLEEVSFKLEIPDALSALKPNWVVGMPRNKEVHIYKHDIPQKGPDIPAQTVYECFLVSKRTGRPVHNSTYWYRDQTFTDIHRLKYALIDLAAVLGVKKRISRSVEATTDDDDE